MTKIIDEFSDIKDKGKRFRLRHPEKASESVKKYRLAHPEKHREINKRYNKKHPEVTNAASKRYRLKYPEKWKERQRKYAATEARKFKRHQDYLDKGRHYEGRQRALKQLVKRNIMLAYQRLIEMAEKDAFDMKNSLGKAILIEDLAFLIKDCNKFYTNLSIYKISVPE